MNLVLSDGARRVAVVVGLYLATLGGLATASAMTINDGCRKAIQTLVDNAAKQMSGDNAAGMASDGLNGPVLSGAVDVQGRSEFKVAVSQIFVGSGNLLGGNATAWFVPNANSCDHIRLEISPD